MANSIKKRGQKLLRKFSRASVKVGEDSKEHIKENLIARASHISDIKLLICEWGLLVLGLIMLSLAQAFWFSDSYAEHSFTSGGTYTEATLGKVSSMNPLFATTSSEKALSRLMFATIAEIDYSGHMNIGLAKSISASEDGKTWTIKLRDNLKWSDDMPITNEDVIFTAELIKNPAVNSIYDTNLSNVKISESENGEIIFSLPAPYADFISALNFPIVPKHILGDADPKTLIENNFSNSPITSGAFTFNALQSTGNDTVIYLSANKNYFEKKPLLNAFAIHAYDNLDEIINAVNNGSVTATAELSGHTLDKIKNNQFYQKNSSLNSGAFIFFNTKRNAIKDRDLRAAIRQGIDLSKIRQAAPDTVVIDFPLLESQIKLSNYPGLPATDTEAAKAKIKELAGDEPLRIDIATVNSGYLPDVTEAIKSELETLGIEPIVSVYEENQEFISNVVTKRNYDILVYEIELGADPDLLPYYHSSQTSATGLNLSNYQNTLTDDLLLGARDTLDEALRIKKYEKFLEYWTDGVPAIALYQPNLTYLYNKNVRTFGNDVKLVTALDRFSDVTSWAVNKTTKNKTP